MAEPNARGVNLNHITVVNGFWMQFFNPKKLRANILTFNLQFLVGLLDIITAKLKWIKYRDKAGIMIQYQEEFLILIVHPSIVATISVELLCLTVLFFKYKQTEK